MYIENLTSAITMDRAVEGDGYNGCVSGFALSNISTRLRDVPGGGGVRAYLNIAKVGVFGCLHCVQACRGPRPPHHY